jgi:hypothetical protein
MWMHVGLVVAIVGIVVLNALGVVVPTAVVYLVLLACPLMMVFMMFGMKHDRDGTGHESRPDDEHQPHPPAGVPR